MIKYIMNKLSLTAAAILFIGVPYFIAGLCFGWVLFHGGTPQ